MLQPRWCSLVVTIVTCNWWAATVTVNAILGLCLLFPGRFESRESDRCCPTDAKHLTTLQQSELLDTLPCIICRNYLPVQLNASVHRMYIPWNSMWWLIFMISSFFIILSTGSPGNVPTWGRSPIWRPSNPELQWHHYHHNCLWVTDFSPLLKKRGMEAAARALIELSGPLLAVWKAPTVHVCTAVVLNV